MTSQKFHAVVMTLVAANVVVADETGGMRGATIGLLQTETNPTNQMRIYRDRFDGHLDDSGYVCEYFTGQSAEEVLESNPHLLLVIASAFASDDTSFTVSLYWRPNGRRTIEGVGVDEDDPIADVANEAIRFFEDDIAEQLRAYERTQQRTKCDGSINEARDAFVVGRFDEAIEIATQALGEAPDEDQRFRILYLRGQAHKKAGNLDDARADFMTVKDDYEKDDSALLELGNVAFIGENFQEAEGHYLSVVNRRDVNAIKARWNLALLYQSQGRVGEAQSQLDALPNNSSHTFDAGQLQTAINYAIDRADRRSRMLQYLWKSLLGLAVVVIAVILTTMYRRAQRDPDLTAAQRLDFAGKLMGGLFSMLSLLGGTMLGMFLAR